MTIQIKDLLSMSTKNSNPIEGDILYVLAGSFIFNPNDYGFSRDSQIVMSNCFKGYKAIYELRDNTLVLNNLNINSSNLVNLNGAEGTKMKTCIEAMFDDYFKDDSNSDKDNDLPLSPNIFNCFYENINLAINFSGSILVGIDEKADSDSFSVSDSVDYWFEQYQNLTVLDFIDGKLVKFTENISQSYLNQYNNFKL